MVVFIIFEIEQNTILTGFYVCPWRLLFSICPYFKKKVFTYEFDHPDASIIPKHAVSPAETNMADPKNIWNGKYKDLTAELNPGKRKVMKPASN